MFDKKVNELTVCSLLLTYTQQFLYYCWEQVVSKHYPAAVAGGSPPSIDSVRDWFKFNVAQCSANTPWKNTPVCRLRVQKDESPQNPYMYVSYDGTVTSEEDIKVVSTCRMDVHKFPFDTQRCNISIGSAIHSGEGASVFVCLCALCTMKKQATEHWRVWLTYPIILLHRTPRRMSIVSLVVLSFCIFVMCLCHHYVRLCSFSLLLLFISFWAFVYLCSSVSVVVLCLLFLIFLQSVCHFVTVLCVFVVV